jgi:hypothetical protein
MHCEDEIYPYIVVLDDKDTPNKVEMFKWCVEQWGRPRHNKPINWKTDHVMIDYNKYIFKFTNSKDREWFILKWA